MFAAGALLLGGCAQQYAGINKGQLTYDPETKSVNVEIVGGKEQDSISLSGKTPDGLEFAYSATGACAFEGQAIRGEVDKAITETVGEVAPGIVDTLTARLCNIIGVVC